MKTYHDIKGDGGSDIAGQVGDQKDRLDARMASVHRIIAVASGKGGVGKSTITANLAAHLAAEGHTVGVMDADINGSSIPKMLGVRGAALERSSAGVFPAEGHLGIKIMSIDFFLANDEIPVQWISTVPRDAFTWRGMVEMGALREMLTDTVWGVLDYLLIDVPPGTDKLSNVADLLPRLSGVLLISIPSGVSQLVVGKSMHLAKQRLDTRIIGVVENMASYACPVCGHHGALFPANGLEHAASRFGIPYLGKIPLEPELALAADRGAVLLDHPHLPAVRAIHALAQQVKDFFKA